MLATDKRLECIVVCMIRMTRSSTVVNGFARLSRRACRCSLHPSLRLTHRSLTQAPDLLHSVQQSLFEYPMTLVNLTSSSLLVFSSLTSSSLLVFPTQFTNKQSL